MPTRQKQQAFHDPSPEQVVQLASLLETLVVIASHCSCFALEQG